MKNFGSLFYKPKKSAGDKPKRWNIFSIVWKAIKRTCTAIGAMVLISTIISIIMISKMAGNVAPPLPDDMVLVFKIDGGVTEIQSKPSFLEPFPFDQPSIRNVIDTLDRAKDDARVRGLVISLKNSGMSVAHIQELRSAISRFKESGKFTKIYASSYDDPMGGLSQYYLASAFDEIWMQPVGMLSISGANMEMPFARNVFDKVGVQPQFLKREKYKGAMENFTASEMSAPNREMWSAIIGNMSARMMSDISNDRDMSMMALGKYVDKGILTSNEALNAKLIDRLDYADVMVSEIRKEIKGDPDDKSLELIALSRYSQGKAKHVATKKINEKTKDSVALVYAVGAIVDTAGAKGNAGADKISSAITQAYEDEDIKAIVLRVDSPGGSPSASETIRRAVVKAKEAGKIVVVSMGPVAASGGYWIATDADRIVALPATITGSIGVIMGKFEASALWAKLGITWDGPKMGANANIWSPHQPFNEAGTARMNVLIDDIYDQFLSRVAKGRNLTKTQVREVAQGRAWTGEQAKLNGLVDTLGGLDVAMDETAKLLGRENRDDLTIIQIPKELNKIERFIELFTPNVSLGNFLGLDSKIMKQFKAYITQAELTNNASGASVYDADLEMFR
jgi:protease-4